MKKLVLLEQLQLGVFTEVLHAEVNGTVIKDLDKFFYYPTSEFARFFTANFEDIAQTRDVLKTLLGLTSLAALAKGVSQIEVNLPVDYYLTRYPVARVATPSEVEVLKVADKGAGLELAGGASLMALVAKLAGGDSSALQQLVVKTRPRRESLSWTFELRIRAGQIIDIDVPDKAGDPSQVASLASHAEFLCRKKAYEAAIEGHTKVLQLAPDSVSVYVSRGLASYSARRYGDAINDFSKAIELSPRAAEAYTNRGLAYCGQPVLRPLRDRRGAGGYPVERVNLDTAQYDKAISDHTKALEINPSFAEAYNNRGSAQTWKGEYQRAIADFSMALKLDPKLAGAHSNRAIAYFFLKDYSRCIDDYTKALEFDLTDAETYVNRAAAYTEAEQFTEAAADLNRAIEINPRLAEAYSNRGVLFARVKRFQQAIADYSESLRLSPSAEIFANRGLAYGGAGQTDMAIADYTQALKLKPELKMLHRLRAMNYMVKRQYALALADYAKALEFDPRDAEAYEGRGMVHWALNDVKAACSDWRKACELGLCTQARMCR